MRRVLVTGGAGFLGSHLCDRLLSDAVEVLCVDNFFTGAKANVRQHLSNPNFELMRHDVTFPLYVEVDRNLQPGVPGLAHSLPARSGPDDQDQRAWRDQYAGIGEAAESPNSSGLDL